MNKQTFENPIDAYRRALFHTLNCLLPAKMCQDPEHAEAQRLVLVPPSEETVRLEGRNGGWIQTFTGKQFWPLDPRVEDIDINDIAHALSNLCRFNGHSTRFYSVAEHCCHVSDLLSFAHDKAGLLHDASEAYLCDLPRPVKTSAAFRRAYSVAEDQLMKLIARKFGFDWPLAEAVKQADAAMLGTEAEQIMATPVARWKYRPEAVPSLRIECWQPERAEEEFQRRFTTFIW